MNPTLSDIQSLARQAGAVLRAGFIQRPGFERIHQVKFKGAIDLVTEMDHRSEAYLLGEIQRRWPDHQIVAEESGILPGQDSCQWFIDPLDGTVNYAHGIPIFAVSVGYAESGVMRLGAVYDPMQDELFSAERERGAWLNELPIRSSDTQDLDVSLLVTGFPYDVWTNPQNNLDLFMRFMLRSQSVRRLGSAVIDLCYIATGRFDGYWETQLGPWDLAAGTLIAQEAGAFVTNMQGELDFFKPPYAVIAANPILHSKILAVIHEGQSSFA